MVSRAWATHSSASRWRGPGTPARKLSTNRPTTSGAAPNSNGTTSPAAVACRCESTSTRSDSASGWPCESSDIHPRCSSATPALRRKACASSGSRLRRETTRSRSPHPGSWRHAPPGAFLPATTTSEHAGSAGTNCSRSQSSRPPAASKVSSSRTAGSLPASASRADASAGSPSARASSAMNAGGEGSIVRTSRFTTGTSASAAASPSARIRAVLPTPPGPQIHSTLNCGSAAASAPRNSSSSAARPTNRRRRALFKRSATVEGGGGSNEACRVVGDILSYGA